MSLLFSKTSLGPLALQNRLVMAPLTRNRATGREKTGIRLSPFGVFNDMPVLG